MRVAELAARYDDRLRTEDFADVDPSANGLQVGDADAEVGHAAFAVDAAQATIDAAADAGADVLCTHHGLVWGGLERVTGRTYDRLASLVESDLALYVAHLPLDAHPELGNAAGVADVLGLDEREPFGREGPETIGLRGRVADGPVGRPTLVGRLEDGLDAGGDVRTLDFGPDEVEGVAVVTGSGADWLEATAAAGLDTLVTGEGKQSHAEEWGLATTYLDHPTGF